MALTSDDLSRFFGCLDTASRAGPVPGLRRPAVVRFKLGDAGVWTLRASPTEAGSVEREDTQGADAEAADCTCSCSLDVLLDVATGRRKPAAALMKGLISIKGDREVFHPMASVLKAAAAEFKQQRRRAAEDAANAPGALRVLVHGASVVADRRETFAVYLLEVFEAEARWTLTRRWSEVRALERRIARMRPAVRGVVGLPRSLDFAGSLEPAFLARRAQLVGSYLADVVRAVPTSVLHSSGPSEALRSFLSPGEGAPLPSTPLGARSSGVYSAGSPFSPGGLSLGMGRPAGADLSMSSGLDASSVASVRESLLLESGGSLAYPNTREYAPRGASPTSMEGMRNGGAWAAQRGSASGLNGASWGGPPRPRAATAPFSPPTTKRVADTYADAFDGLDDDEDEGGGGGEGEGKGPSRGGRGFGPGVLVQRLTAAAAGTPIRAEADEAILHTRRSVLAKLRGMEAAQKRAAASSLPRLLAAEATALALLLLPLLLALLAAAYRWALPMVVLGGRGVAGLIYARRGRGAAAVVALCVLLACYGGGPCGDGLGDGRPALCRLGASRVSVGASTAAPAARAASAGGDGCRDISEECAGWAAQGECQANPEYMVASCPVACRAGCAVDALDALAAADGEAAAEAEAAIAAAEAARGAGAGGPAPTAADVGVFARACASAIGRGARRVETHARACLRLRPVLGSIALLLALGFAAAGVFFGRLLQVYALAFVVIMAYHTLKKTLDPLCKRWPRLEPYQDKAYAIAHTLIAPYVCHRLVELKSVYVKFGQYIGGRADMVPPEWSKELMMLQDDLPGCPPRHLRSVLRSEFGAEQRSIFSELELDPIASASVAQVHVGTLAPGAGGDFGGEKVVLKLQHAGVAPLMRTDMVACLRIAKAMQWLNADFTAFHTVMAAWEREMFKELDFTHEAANLTQVRLNLEAASIDAIVPRPVPGLVGVEAFAMSYEEGFKITDVEALAMHGVDREALMRRVVQVYAQQLFVDGFFNADPHAGNLMVQVREGRVTPVLLDFGMTVRLSHAQRLGYARLAFAAQQMDIHGLQAAVTSLGVTNNQTDADPSRDLEFWRYFLRDTGTRDEASAQTKEFFSKRVEQRKSDKAKGVETRKSPQIPDTLIFFWRVIGLLRGLCATLEVRVPYMEILGARAKIAIADETPHAERALALAPPQSLLPHALPLHRRLASALGQMCEDGTISAGVQVCVQRNGVTLAEACAGFLGLVDPRPLHVETLMPLLELSALLPALTLHALVGMRLVHYDTPIDPSWPGCKAAGAAGYTVGEALSHQVPIDGASMWRTSSAKLASLATQLAALAAAPLRTEAAEEEGLNGGPAAGGAAKAGGGPTRQSPPPTAPRSSGVPYGTLLAGIIGGVMRSARSAAGAGAVPGGKGKGKGGDDDASYAGTVHACLIEPLGLGHVVYGCGMEEEVQAEVASVSTGFAAQLQHLSSMAAGEAGAGGEAGEAGGGKAGGGGMGGGMGERLMSEVPLNAGMVNAPAVRSGCVPSLGAYGTARGLCALLGAAARGELGVAASELATGEGVEDSVLFGERRWGRGLQKYECRGGTEPHVLGLHSFGGSVAFLCPRSGLSVAILINDCQLDYSTTRRVLEGVANECRLGQIDFLGGGLF